MSTREERDRLVDRLHLALQSANMGTWEWNVAEERNFFDEYLPPLFGLDPRTTVAFPDDFMNSIHPDDRQRFRSEARRSAELGDALAVDFRVIWPDGSIHHLAARARGYRDAAGQPQRMVGVCWDITAAKHAEEQLHTSESRYRSLFFDSPIPLWEEDFSEVKQLLDGLRREGVADFDRYLADHPEVVRQCAAKVRVLNINDAVLRLHRTESRDEAIAMVNSELGGSLQDMFSQELAKIARGETCFDLDVAIPTVNNEHLHTILRWTAAPGYEATLGKVFVAAIDISRQKAAEERLQQLQTQLTHVARLSVGGELVAGIAHEVNQPLYAILNYAQASSLLLESPEPDLESLRQWNQQIAAAASRAGEIIRRLRDFVRRREPEMSAVEVRELVRDALEMLRFEARQRGITVREEVAPGSYAVVVDRVQMHQVFVNLLHNAFEAMENSHGAEKRVTVTAAPRPGFVEFSIADNGPGIPPDEVSRLFEPFHTTKPGGLGIGLAISKPIVEAHRGRLWFELGQKVGATFRLVLPLAEAS